MNHGINQAAESWFFEVEYHSPPLGYARRSGIKTAMPRYVFIASALIIATACIPLSFTAKWIGHFTLTVDLNVAPVVDTSSITYVEAWDRDVATWLCNHRPDFSVDFEPPAMATPETHSITITCSGDSGAFGILDTYRHPEFLVVQYRMVDAPTDEVSRKLLEIPAGRGPRRTLLVLP